MVKYGKQNLKYELINVLRYEICLSLLNCGFNNYIKWLFPIGTYYLQTIYLSKTNTIWVLSIFYVICILVLKKCNSNLNLCDLLLLYSWKITTVINV